MPGKSANLLNNAVFFFFLLFLFSSTFSIAVSQISLGLSLVAFLILIVTTRYNPFSKNLISVYYAIAMYVLWQVITSLVGATPSKSLIMLREEWLFCIIPIGIYLLRQRHYRHLLITALAAGVILVCIYSVFQHFTGVNWFKSYPLAQARDNTFYARGGFSHNLTFGNFMATASIFLISIAVLKGKQLLKMPNLIFTIAGLAGLLGTVMSYSRTAIAALPIALVALIWLKGKRWALISSAVVIALIALTPLLFGELARKYEVAFKNDLAGDSDNSRLYIWKKSLAIASDNPVFGVGEGNFETNYTKQIRPGEIARTRPHAHNDVLNQAAVFGFPGALFFLLIWVAVFYKLHRIWHDSALESDKKILAGAAAVGGLAFFLTSLTEATFADEEIRQLLMLVWAAGLWPLFSVDSKTNSETVESA